MKTIEKYKQKLEKIKRESCVLEIQEVVKDYNGKEDIKTLKKMLEKVECRIIAYRFNCIISQ